MGRAVPADDLPGAESPFESALKAEGVSGLVADIARSIYQQESGSGKNTKTSNAGAVGGMQIIPATFNRMADKGWAIDNPEQNARAGVRYIKALHEKSGGDPALTAAGYYGGEGGMEKARRGVAVSDPRNPRAPNTLQYGQQVAARLPPAESRAVPADDLPEAPTPAPAAPVKAPATTITQDLTQGAGNLAAGLVRGAGSIGATLLAPRDALEGFIARKMGAPELQPQDRRKAMDAGLETMGAEPDSLMYKGGKLAGEIAGTAGVGGAAANLAARVPGVAAAAPNLLASIASGGFRAGTATGAANVATRAAGGAITGGLAAGLVNPEDAGAGAAIGGVLPPALMAAGGVGRAIGGVMRGPAPAPELMAAAQQARAAGYVMPPTQVKPTLTNRLLEGFSGKITTAQNASAKNQVVTNRLAALAVGLPGDAPITPDALNAVREEAGKAYQALAALPERPAVAANSLTNRTAIEGFSPKQALQDLRQARNDATAWFTAYGRSASPDDQAKAKAAAALASSIEKKFEEYAKDVGQDSLVPAMQDARRLIAKTYTIEKALNPTTGTIDARKLGAMVTKGKPLTDGLREAGEFANRFPKAAQPLEGMGSLPQTSPLDWFAGGAMSAATANPLMMAGVVARPMARAAALSGPVQNRLVQAPNQNRLAQLLANSSAGQLPYRVVPVALSDR